MTNVSIEADRNETGRVSALVISYNQEQFISETLESVLAQTYKEIEIVVADDGSTDGTQEIIRRVARENPSRFKLALNPKNTGIASNINRALELNSGEFIAWLGGDDLWLPEKIEKQVAYMRAHRNVTGCHTDADVFVSKSGASLGRFSEVYGRGGRKLPEGGVEVFFDVRAPMLPSTVMIRAEAARGYRFDERLRYANDWLFDIEVFREGRIGVVREVLARYRRHDANVSLTTKMTPIAAEEAMMTLAVVSIRYPELFPLLRRRRSSIYLTQMVKAVEKGDMKRARALLRISLKDGHKVRGALLYLALVLGAQRMIHTVEGSTRLKSLARSFVR